MLHAGLSYTVFMRDEEIQIVIRLNETFILMLRPEGDWEPLESYDRGIVKAPFYGPEDSMVYVGREGFYLRRRSDLRLASLAFQGVYALSVEEEDALYNAGKGE